MVYYFLIIFTVVWGLLCKACTPKFFNKDTSIKLFLIPVYSIAFLIMGFRGINVGLDTKSYFTLFKSFHGVSFGEALNKEVEPLWGISSWLVNQFVESFLIFQLIISSLFCFLVARFIYSMCTVLKKDYSLVMTVVILAGIYINSFNIIRQLVAIMLVITSWDYFRVKKYFLSIVIFCSGVLIHSSAVLGIILFGLWYLRKWRFYILFSLSIIILSYLFFNFISNYLIALNVYSNYVNNAFGKFMESNLSKIVWVIIAIFSLFILLRKRNFTSFDIFVAICCLIYVLCNVLASKMNYFERIGLYFLPFVSVLYPIIGNSFKNKSIRIIYYSGVITMYSLWFILASRSEQYIYTLNI